MSASPEWQRGVSAPSGPSTFVTVIAWIFIGLSAFTTIIATLQNVILSLAFSSTNEFPIEQAQRAVPPVLAFMMGHMRLYFLAFLIVSVVTLVASIGLLRRRNWARLLFIAILGIGILWNVGGIVLQNLVIGSMLAMPHDPHLPADFDQAAQAMTSAIRVVSAFFALAFGALFVWIIARLRSPEIAAEFQ